MTRVSWVFQKTILSHFSVASLNSEKAATLTNALFILATVMDGRECLSSYSPLFR
jgi:hypothetical protein